MKAERKSTSVSTPSRRIALSTCVPSSPGMRMSRTATSGESFLIRSSAARPSAGLADQLEVRPLLDGAHDALAIDRVVIGDEHADTLRASHHVQRESTARSGCREFEVADLVLDVVGAVRRYPEPQLEAFLGFELRRLGTGQGAD